MKYRKLGNKINVSAVGFGCMGMTHEYGKPSNINEMKKLLQEAVEIGYTMFDTAECYSAVNDEGIIQYNEELVGSALKLYRDKIVISTKFGVTIEKSGLITDSRPETIRKSVDSSLKRLGTDYIDLYFQHRIDEKLKNIKMSQVFGGSNIKK